MSSGYFLICFFSPLSPSTSCPVVDHILKVLVLVLLEEFSFSFPKEFLSTFYYLCNVYVTIFNDLKLNQIYIFLFNI